MWQTEETAREREKEQKCWEIRRNCEKQIEKTESETLNDMRIGFFSVK